MISWKCDDHNRVWIEFKIKWTVNDIDRLSVWFRMRLYVCTSYVWREDLALGWDVEISHVIYKRRHLLEHKCVAWLYHVTWPQCRAPSHLCSGCKTFSQNHGSSIWICLLSWQPLLQCAKHTHTHTHNIFLPLPSRKKGVGLAVMKRESTAFRCVCADVCWQALAASAGGQEHREICCPASLNHGGQRRLTDGIWSNVLDSQPRPRPQQPVSLPGKKGGSSHSTGPRGATESVSARCTGCVNVHEHAPLKCYFWSILLLQL